jgi:hypothetical protein
LTGIASHGRPSSVGRPFFAPHSQKNAMQKLLLFVDKVSAFAGRFFSWSIIGLTFLISW